MVVFIVLRHVNTELSNEFWQESCAKINEFYPDKQIFIIDDNSNKNFLKQTRELKNITVIQSEFTPGKGEILPYYYFNKHKWDTHAIVFHDSVFINDYFLDENNLPSKVKFLWHTDSHWSDDRYKEAIMMKELKNNKELLNYFWTQKNNWALCFGVMSVINYDYLTDINNKYDIFNKLMPIINTRDDRMRLERIFGVICCFECNEEMKNNKSYIGDIDIINRWSYNWNDYKTDVENKRIKLDYPYALVKTFVGR